MSHYGHLTLLAAGITGSLVLAGTTIAGAIDAAPSCTPGPSAHEAHERHRSSATCTAPKPSVETVTATATATAAATATATATATVTVTARPPQKVDQKPTSNRTPGKDGAPSSTPTTAGPSPTDTATVTTPAGGPFLPYTAGSYFYSAPSDYGTIDPTLTSQMRSFMATFGNQKNTPYPLLTGVGGNQWGMVYAEGSAGDPVWTLSGAVPPEVANRL